MLWVKFTTKETREEKTGSPIFGEETIYAPIKLIFKTNGRTDIEIKNTQIHKALAVCDHFLVKTVYRTRQGQVFMNGDWLEESLRVSGNPGVPPDYFELSSIEILTEQDVAKEVSEFRL